MDKIGHCKTCKWWGFIDYNGDEAKSCGSPNLGHGIYRPGDGLPNNGAIVDYDEAEGLITGPDFGCTNYEEGELETRRRVKELVNSFDKSEIIRPSDFDE